MSKHSNTDALVLKGGQTIRFASNADEGAEVQLAYAGQCSTFFLDLLLPEAVKLRRLLGNAIKRETRWQAQLKTLRKARSK